MEKIAIVTGANSGIGLYTAKALYKDGYNVILACRNENSALQVIKEIKTNRNNTLQFIRLDLEDRQSIEQFCTSFKKQYTHLNLLINNAGVMFNKRIITENNLERDFDVNFMGHFYLTYLLYDYLSMSDEPKIITVSSLAHKRKRAQINFADINFSNSYSPWTAYCQSKLACAIFAKQLSKSSKVKSIIVHPGVTNTKINKTFLKIDYKVLAPFLFILPISKPSVGAQSLIYAALKQNIISGSYIGPTGFKNMVGKPGIDKLSDKAMDDVVGKQLWKLAEEHLHIKFEL